MQRVPIIAGNWKMYKTGQEARDFVRSLSLEMGRVPRRILLAVPYTAIEQAVDAAKNSTIVIGAQNMHDHREGAFTGEISGPMLKAVGAKFVLVGHSERRTHCGETNGFIHRKVMRALEEQLIPVLCIGESLSEREEMITQRVLSRQLEECLESVTADQLAHLIIAYEPVWAIGTGKTATPEMAQEAHQWIRQFVRNRWGKQASDALPIIYGGSVKPDNIKSLMAQDDIDGALVGGASLDVTSFLQLINY